MTGVEGGAGEVRLVEIVALLAVAQDHGFGQPAGSQLRATVLAQELATAAGLDDEARTATWWTSALRFLGCTGHAFETAVVFGDEIDLRAGSLRADAANPVEFLRLMLSHAGPGTTGVARVRSVLSLLAGGRKSAELNFRAACEVADAFAARLGLDEPVRAALAANFERWNGRGLPKGLKGAAIPTPMRIAQLSQELEVLARVEGIERALEIVRSRRGRAYDPELTDVVLEQAPAWWEAVEPADPWDGALAVAPPGRPLDDAAVRDALLVLADFADLKSPWTNGHSRAVAALALEACGKRVIAAADCYQAMVSDRPHRAALTPEAAARELRAMSAAGALDGEAVERVLAAAGHRRMARPPRPAGLTAREEGVLRLVALGLTTRQVADRLGISPKTADHHVQHIYTKLGVSTRGAAALFAIEHGILPTDA